MKIRIPGLAMMGALALICAGSGQAHAFGLLMAAGDSTLSITRAQDGSIHVANAAAAICDAQMPGVPLNRR